jgi:hypothetical protein
MELVLQDGGGLVEWASFSVLLTEDGAGDKNPDGWVFQALVWMQESDHCSTPEGHNQAQQPTGFAQQGINVQRQVGFPAQVPSCR